MEGCTKIRKARLALPVILLVAWMAISPSPSDCFREPNLISGQRAVALIAGDYVAIHYPWFDTIKHPPRFMIVGARGRSNVMQTP